MGSNEVRNKGCGWMNRVSTGWVSVPRSGMKLKGCQWVWWLMHGWRKCVERRGGRAEVLYLPAASPHRNSCLSDCNRCRFTEGGEMVWQLLRFCSPTPLFLLNKIYLSLSFNFLLWKDFNTGDTYLHSLFIPTSNIKCLPTSYNFWYLQCFSLSHFSGPCFRIHSLQSTTT